MRISDSLGSSLTADTAGELALPHAMVDCVHDPVVLQGAVAFRRVIIHSASTQFAANLGGSDATTYSLNRNCKGAVFYFGEIDEPKVIRLIYGIVMDEARHIAIR